MNTLMTAATFAAVVAFLWIAKRSSAARVKSGFSSYGALVSYPLARTADEFILVTVEDKNSRPIKVRSFQSWLCLSSMPEVCIFSAFVALT